MALVQKRVCFRSTLKPGCGLAAGLRVSNNCKSRCALVLAPPTAALRRQIWTEFELFGRNLVKKLQAQPSHHHAPLSHKQRLAGAQMLSTSSVARALQDSGDCCAPATRLRETLLGRLLLAARSQSGMKNAGAALQLRCGPWRARSQVITWQLCPAAACGASCNHWSQV